MHENSRFYGIVIKMFFDDHEPPHFHVEYAEHQAVVSIETLALIGRFRQGRWGWLRNGQLYVKKSCARLGRERRISNRSAESILSHSKKGA